MEPENKADGSRTMRAGTLEDWRDAKANEVGEKPADAVPDGTTTGPETTDPSSNDTAGTQQRGTREDWWRKAEPSNATEAAGDAASAAGGSAEIETDDAGNPKETVTLRDGTLRD